jgi:hypothetical protein
MQTGTPILKGWHDLPQTNDTPSGLAKRRTTIHNFFTPSELLLEYSSFDRVFGCSLKHEDAFQNTHVVTDVNQVLK